MSAVATARARARESVDGSEVEVRVVDAGQRSLSELAEEANREHHLALASGMAMIEHAITAGEALLAARAQCPHGEWTRWLANNFDGGPTRASAYTRLAHYQDLVRACRPNGINEAVVYLRGLVGPTRRKPGMPRQHAVEVQERAVELREASATYQEIADLLGVSDQTVRRWCDPEFSARQNAASLERKRKRAQERKDRQAREREEKIKVAVRKAGAAMSELYVMAERMQDVMAQAHSEATDVTARKHLSLAGRHYRAMRDEIVRALGVS